MTVLELINYHQASFNTTMMGVMRGVLNYYDMKTNDSTMFVHSGHAFMTCIHKDLCQSSPYAWDLEKALPLISNLGIKMKPLGFFNLSCVGMERERLENLLKQQLRWRQPLSLLNLEHQLIYGMDEGGFLISQPWVGMDFPPNHLTFETWEELGTEIHMSIFQYERKPANKIGQSLTDAVNYAIDLWDNSDNHASGNYKTGKAAYELWIAGLEAGFGDTHGHWWNTMVWSECKSFVAQYFRDQESIVQNEEIASLYEQASENLVKAGVKGLATDAKIELIKAAYANEAAGVNQLRALLSQIPTEREGVGTV